MITVIIPCYNEELTIGKTIQELKSLGENNLEIIVVDNSSTDSTAALARNFGAKVIKEPIKGKGRAFRRGLSAMDKSTSIICLIDGDNTYGVEKLSDAKNLILDEGFEMVVGSRKKAESLISLEYRAGHQFGNFIFTRVNKLLFNSNINDSLSGWRVMSQKFALSFFGGNSNFELEMELNVHAFRLGVPVTSVDVQYRNRPKNSVSKLNTIRDGYAIFRKTIQLFKQERPKVAYSLLGLPFLLVGIILFNRAFFNFILTGTVEYLPSLVVSVICILITFSFWITGTILENNLKTRLDFARFIYNYKDRA
jgi:glycosyltransferase involved in cell wall biosynthesis